MMRRLAALILIPLALSLSGCAGLAGLMTGIPSAPVQVANKTTLDESDLLGLEAAFKTFRIAVEFGVDVGKIKGKNASDLDQLRGKLYGFVSMAEDAYKAANGETYKAALKSGWAAINEGNALMGGQ